jgi:hypothetical protein
MELEHPNPVVAREPGARPERPFPDDPVVEAYEARVDRDGLRANLRLSPHERVLKATAALRQAAAGGPQMKADAFTREQASGWIPPEDDGVERPFPYDPVVAVYKRDVDRTLLRANLCRTPHERVQMMMGAMRLAEGLRQAGIRARRERE